MLWERFERVACQKSVAASFVLSPRSRYAYMRPLCLWPPRKLLFSTRAFKILINFFPLLQRAKKCILRLRPIIATENTSFPTGIIKKKRSCYN